MEDLVAKLFQRLGYEVQKNVRVAGTEVDLIIGKDGLLFPVEVKSYAKFNLPYLQRQAVRLRSLQDIDEHLQNPIIVLLGKLIPEATCWAQQQFNLQIWDIDALFEKVRPYAEIHEELKKFERTSRDRRHTITRP